MKNVEELKSKSKTWMQKQLKHNFKDYDDCGEVNTTKLAEDCANEFDLFEDEDSQNPPEWMFEQAVDVEDWYRKV